VPIAERELVAGFGAGVQISDASVFVGAGLSMAAGLPAWEELIADARSVAEVPTELDDAPLAAQYIADVNGAQWLHGELRRKLDRDASPTPVHHALARLPLRDYWTTNYDNLMEDALDMEGAKFQRIFGEHDYARAASAAPMKRVTKMHGSLDRGETGRRQWEADATPVITRSDFERYEEFHPITWARLRASWLTNNLLFLGLSFDDPNLNLLLRLSRSLPKGVDAPRHFAVFARKTEEPDRRLQELRVKDLENSGVSVHVLESHDDLEPLLKRLEVRCRRLALFVSGSFSLAEDSRNQHAVDVASALALNLADADPDLTLMSFGSAPGQVMSKQFRDALSDGTYRPDRIQFYFRKAQGGDEKVEVPNRVGTVVFTELPLPEMRKSVLPQARCLVLVGGGTRSEEEVEQARSLGLAVVPLATTGGAAQSIWSASSPADLGLDAPQAASNWEKLDSPQPAVAANAAARLIRSAMFE